MEETLPTQDTQTNDGATFDVVAEIKNAIAVIDHAADQGAFKGWNVVNQVLAVRGRLSAFIEMMEAALAQQNMEAAVEQQPVAPETADEPADGVMVEAEYADQVFEVSPPEGDLPPSPQPEPTPVDSRTEELAARYERAKQELELLQNEINQNPQ